MGISDQTGEAMIDAFVFGPDCRAETTTFPWQNQRSILRHERFPCARPKRWSCRTIPFEQNGVWVDPPECPRCCIASAALRFAPCEGMETEGREAYIAALEDIP
jgi:hypothetical protein